MHCKYGAWNVCCVAIGNSSNVIWHFVGDALIIRGVHQGTFRALSAALSTWRTQLPGIVWHDSAFPTLAPQSTLYKPSISTQQKVAFVVLSLLVTLNIFYAQKFS